MVLESWVTPSLFYRFLGKTKSEGVGMESYSFCEALGPSEGNKVMRDHWNTWFTEDHIAALAKRGIEMVRLPIGDWALEPYGPFVGCMDGAKEKIDWMFDICAKYNIQIFLVVHSLKGNANGFDNGGQNDYEWTDETHFRHWPVSAAKWKGFWDVYNSVKMSEKLIERWAKHPAFAAFEPVNEPEWNTFLDAYYVSVREILRKHNPKAKFVFSIGFDPLVPVDETGNDIFPDDDMENVVLDRHHYHVWNKGLNTTEKHCALYEENAALARKVKYEVWFGEWSLATDICAMWIGGFNDAK